MPKITKLSTYNYEGLEIKYRPDSSDEKCIREILERKEYCKKSIGFDVERGEHWLDLGANIGVFSAYCLARGATADCYEPESSSFKILKQNVPTFNLVNACVSHLEVERLNLFHSRCKGNYYRGTLLGNVGAMQKEPTSVMNIYAGTLLSQQYDGIKLDIEGAEFGLIDNDLLPRCEKICLEYHLSRDRSIVRLKRRVDWLQSRFKTVWINSETRGIIKRGVDDKGWQDRIMWGIGRK